ncbi:hypothetical protein, variant [Aphanomyces astaci]|uniref:Polynucleotide 5'-hydroxyl-kinase NOL9 n=1 Tax=Aphanomyces astaci TaxID=112090 RepID=W4FJX1_APHAT|nr:hypothetical protein, variant [Aphanomyces astaci]ETV67785.1 hypothetical protein, variant [Aphanomyces astaci]|eukprot:XP_009842777.1 hypothetical protein, variant [Aphanomyces astaci]
MEVQQAQMQQLMDAYCATEDKVSCTPSKKHVVIGMEAEEKLVGAGMVHLRVFQGGVSILGFHAKAGAYLDVFSPRWSNLLSIQGIATTSVFQSPCTSLTEAHWNLTHVDDRLTMADEAEADALAKDIAVRFPIVLVFRSMHVTYGNLASYFDGGPPSATTNDMVVPMPGFKFIRHKNAAHALDKPKTKKAKHAASNADGSSVLYHGESVDFTSITSLEPHPVREILIPPTWSKVAASILDSMATSANRKMLVCGAKGVGKSTFSRYVVNRLLNVYPMVAYLDTDVGQPELAAPGVLSLHYITSPLLGPGYTHLEPAYRSYFFGFSSPKADPTVYMEAISALLNDYAAKDSTIPLVLNTDGWIKSMGYDLLQATLSAATPEHVVQVVALSKAKSFDVPLSPQWTLHPIEMWDIEPPQPARSGKELRQFRLHAYFLGRVPVPSHVSLQNIHCTSEQTRYTRLLSTIYPQQAPYRVPFSKVGLRVSGGSVPPSQILHVLNASVVGLCCHPYEIKPDATNGGPVTVLDNPMVPCVGHGIVRSIDVERREFHILTPVPFEILQHVNLLVRGHISLAFQLLDQSAVYGTTPYAVVDVLAAEGTGASLMESRNNLKRKKEMT